MPTNELRSGLLVIEPFYADPDRVRTFALGCDYESPYRQATGRYEPTQVEDSYQEPTDRWRTSTDRHLTDETRAMLEAAIGSPIDRQHWREGTRWNGRFQIKLEGMDGFGAHNHVDDGWNGVGQHGWCGIVFLTPSAPRDRGLSFWSPKNPQSLPPDGWIIGKDPSDWRRLESVENVYNRAVVHRGDLYHNGAAGFGNDPATGRMIQTFFVREAS